MAGLKLVTRINRARNDVSRLHRKLCKLMPGALLPAIFAAHPEHPDVLAYNKATIKLANLTSEYRLRVHHG